jgi:hypothetical protein
MLKMGGIKNIYNIFNILTEEVAFTELIMQRKN